MEYKDFMLRENGLEIWKNRQNLSRITNCDGFEEAENRHLNINFMLNRIHMSHMKPEMLNFCVKLFTRNIQ
jgi:hypothetical protein